MEKKQNLCIDKADHYNEIKQELVKRGYIPHILQRREKRNPTEKHSEIRWAVNTINSRHNNSGNYSQDIKRSMRTIPVLCNSYSNFGSSYVIHTEIYHNIIY
jgi:hypothetical protein